GQRHNHRYGPVAARPMGATMTEGRDGAGVPGTGGRSAEAPDLGALVASRICHDLVNPLGAIGNGVELLALTTGFGPAAGPQGASLQGTAGGSPELALIAESTTHAAARARLFRLAFG